MGVFRVKLLKKTSKNTGYITQKANFQPMEKYILQRQENYTDNPTP